MTFALSLSCFHSNYSAPAAPLWDWIGVIGTGQSLAVGAHAAAVVSTTQPYSNISLFDSNNVYPTANGVGANYSVVPLIEPMRSNAAKSGTAYPTNLMGETPHSGMANQLTALFVARNGGSYITAHSAIGYNSQPLTGIQKGGTTTSYAAAIQEATALKALATAAGKTYGVAGVVLTHGESDAGNSGYGAGLQTLIDNFNTDLKAVTGQTRDVIMFATQQSTSGGTSHVQVWSLANSYPSRVVLVGPKYQWDYDDGLHMVATNYREVGEKMAQVFDKVVNQGLTWKPLQPKTVTRSGAVITITFDVPVPPLQWSLSVDAPHLSDAFAATMGAGRGFEVVGKTISSVAIVGTNQVAITLSADPGAVALTVQYAITGDASGTKGHDRGQLMDSDPFVGLASLQAMPNYCVHFSVTTNTSGVWP